MAASEISMHLYTSQNLLNLNDIIEHCVLQLYMCLCNWLIWNISLCAKISTELVLPIGVYCKLINISECIDFTPCITLHVIDLFRVHKIGLE